MSDLWRSAAIDDLVRDRKRAERRSLTTAIPGYRVVDFLGGPADGTRKVIAEKETIVLVSPGGVGPRALYHICEVAGGTKRYAVAVQAPHHLNGDWIMERLLDGYQP